MVDDKSAQDGRDRSRVSGSEPFEVDYFAQKHGITIKQARELVLMHDNNREMLDREASKLSK